MTFAYSIEPREGYLRAEMLGRESAEQTREFVEAIVAALLSRETPRLLISLRDSRPVFKVEEWNLSGSLEKVAGLPALKVAFVADTRELRLSQEYIALLARQRGLAFQAFAQEKDALAWLLG